MLRSLLQQERRRKGARADENDRLLAQLADERKANARGRAELAATHNTVAGAVSHILHYSTRLHNLQPAAKEEGGGEAGAHRLSDRAAGVVADDTAEAAKARARPGPYCK